jgi:hypothetical protein
MRPGLVACRATEGPGPPLQALGESFRAASNLAARRAKRCAEFSIGRRISGLLIPFARSPSWYHALKRAGIESFRFHELRHTSASWHVQSGTPLFAAQELAGWETERMVRRYAHLVANHLAAYVANAQIHGTFLAHPLRLPKMPDEKLLEVQC